MKKTVCLIENVIESADVIRTRLDEIGNFHYTHFFRPGKGVAEYLKKEKPDFIISELFFGDIPHPRFSIFDELFRIHIPEIYRNIIQHLDSSTKIFILSRHIGYFRGDKPSKEEIEIVLGSAKKKYPQEIKEELEMCKGLNGNEAIVSFLSSLGIDQKHIFSKHSNWDDFFSSIQKEVA